MNDHPDGHDTAPSAGAEPWVYGGIRVLHGKRVHARIDQSGRELLFTLRRASAWAIGSYYTAQVGRHAGMAKPRGTPTYADDGQADDEVRRQLWAHDTAARGAPGPAGPGTQTKPAATASTRPCNRCCRWPAP